MMTRLDVAKNNAHLLIAAMRDKAIEIFGDVATEDALIAMWLAARCTAEIAGSGLRAKFPIHGCIAKALDELVADA